MLYTLHLQRPKSQNDCDYGCTLLLLLLFLRAMLSRSKRAYVLQASVCVYALIWPVAVAFMQLPNIYYRFLHNIVLLLLLLLLLFVHFFFICLFFFFLFFVRFFLLSHVNGSFIASTSHVRSHLLHSHMHTHWLTMRCAMCMNRLTHVQDTAYTAHNLYRYTLSPYLPSQLLFLTSFCFVDVRFL